MEFRPCIDIHNGKVKQIVGGSLKDEGNAARENFVAVNDSAHYADMYRKMGLKGGHVIMLNGRDSEYFAATKKEALKALAAYPGGLQIGGGINAENASEYIEAGASHVIVTSYVFSNGEYHEDRLRLLADTIGRDHVVADLSCRKQGDDYYIVTDRWQKYTNVKLEKALFDEMSEFCDEFLVHAVGVEGTGLGVDKDVLSILAQTDKTITYAGGISSIEDINIIKDCGNHNVNFTIGSCLDIFGGTLGIKEVCECIQ